jgi:hypothetical protein
MAAWGQRKSNAMCAYLTGFHRQHHLWVGRAARQALQLWRTGQCDVCFSRLNHVVSHHVALRVKSQCPDMPWIAHYSDPWPVSNYPPPYKAQFPWPVDYWQQRLNRRILRSANAITVPWTSYSRYVLGPLKDELSDKMFVVHQPNSIVGSKPVEHPVNASDEFVLLHVGHLLSQRTPKALLAGYQQFLRKCPQAVNQSKLRFVGKIHPVHREVYAASHCGNIEVPGSVTYFDSLREMQEASVLIVVQAASPDSIFFPSKLADYLAFSKPILALSPSNGTVAQVLGGTGSLIVNPDDPVQVAEAIGQLFAAWQQRDLSRFLVGDSLRQQFSATFAARQLLQVCEAHSPSPSRSACNARRVPSSSAVAAK